MTLDRDNLLVLIFVALLAFAGWFYYGRTQQPPIPVVPAPIQPVPQPQPKPCPGPGPCPCPGPGPCPRPRAERYHPWALVNASVGGPVHSDGTEIQADLPTNLHVTNRGGSDGAGLCVYASNRHTGLWANNPVFTGMFEYMFQYPGGSYPEKFAKTVRDYARKLGVAEPVYMQVEGTDLEILKRACAAGIMPGVTYSKSPTGRYGGQSISHMVSLVHADDRHFVILDNNYPGSYEWMSPAEFLSAYTGGKSGWATILLEPGAPPIPRAAR